MSVPTPSDNVPQGFSAIPNWLLRDSDVEPAVKLVYLHLSGRVGRDMVCYPSQALIARESGLSVSTVKRAIRSMSDLGLLDVAVQRTERGRRNIYRLNVHPTGGVGSQ